MLCNASDEQFLTCDIDNPFPSSKKWWSGQFSITSNCLNWFGLLVSKENGNKSFFSQVLIISGYELLSSVDCSWVIGCCSAKISQVSKSFLSTKSYSFSFSNVGNAETAPESKAPLSVWNMLALMLEKSSKAARGKEKELHSPIFFSPFSLLTSPFNRSWSYTNVIHQFIISHLHWLLLVNSS